MEPIFIAHIIVTPIISVLAFGQQCKGQSFNTYIFSTVVVAMVAVALLSTCGNTVRGAGQDKANAVNATQDAGKLFVAPLAINNQTVRR